jgi:cob(I)alamin adenosyltransferase
MKKEQFLELAGQLFDQTNVVVSTERTLLSKNTFDEIVDQIGSEVNDMGRDLVDDYTLEMYSNEVTLESIEVDYRAVEKAVREILGRYFEIKEN